MDRYHIYYLILLFRDSLVHPDGQLFWLNLEANAFVIEEKILNFGGEMMVYNEHVCGMKMRPATHTCTANRC